MEASRVTLSGDAVDRFADAFVDAKVNEKKRSINKRGVRNIHRYEGEGFVQVSYERAAVRDPSWLMVSVLVEQDDDDTCTVVVFVGGGGEGPFKLEELTVARLVRGEESFGEAGRFETVLRDVRDVVEELDLTVETEWKTDTDASLAETVERKIFDS
jgi:hypothetical protein